MRAVLQFFIIALLILQMQTIAQDRETPIDGEVIIRLVKVDGKLIWSVFDAGWTWSAPNS